MKLDSHKLNYHPEYLGRILNAKSTQEKLDIHPIYIEISPTSSCNHRCTFCAIDYLGYKGEQLDKVELKQFLLDTSNMGVKAIMFGGEGEPSLYPHLEEMIIYTKEVCDMDVALTTNGSLLTEKFLNNCLPHLSWIKFSIVGCNRRT